MSACDLRRADVDERFPEKSGDGRRWHGDGDRQQADPVARAKLIGGVAATLVVLPTAGLVGYSIGKPATKDVTVSRTFASTVSVVSGDGSEGCVKPSSGGGQLCSAFAVVGGEKVVVGQHVRVAQEWTKQADGAKANLLLLLVYTSRDD